MEISDGFIEGVFNYCDRWCERCAFTSWCRVFANIAEGEASLDPTLTEVVNAPPLPEEVPPPPPKWMQELIEELNEAAAEAADDSAEGQEVRLSPDLERLSMRAGAYCGRVHQWLNATGVADVRDTSHPRQVIAWFHTLVPAKIHRAATGLARDGSGRNEWPPDCEGSAKAALLGIEESHAAWLRLLEAGQAGPADVHSMLDDLVWLGEEIERLFPRARAFVRPAFDEPEAVARLRAAETRR